jgi:hypothetical protein
MAGGRGGTPSWCTGYSVLDCRVRLVDLGLVDRATRARRSLFRFEGVPVHRVTSLHRPAPLRSRPSGLRRAPGQGLVVIDGRMPLENCIASTSIFV